MSYNNYYCNTFYICHNMHVLPRWIENIYHTHTGKFQFVPKID